MTSDTFITACIMTIKAAVKAAQGFFAISFQTVSDLCIAQPPIYETPTYSFLALTTMEGFISLALPAE